MTRHHGWLTAFRRDQRGAAAVEFSIISIVLVALLIGIVDFGRTLYIKNQLSFLADRAARSVLLNASVSNADLETTIRAEFDAGAAEDLTINITTDVIAGDTYRVMTITYPVTLFVPDVVPEAFNLSETRRVPHG
jgi:Flp pilus assembly protein TadG